MEKKITIATIKKFIRTNKNGLYIKHKSSFDGMVDCVMPIQGGFKKVEVVDPIKKEYGIDNTLGVKSAWFVGSSRDYFTPYADDFMVGYEVYNCCGSFLLAFQK